VQQNPPEAKERRPVSDSPQCTLLRAQASQKDCLKLDLEKTGANRGLSKPRAPSNPKHAITHGRAQEGPTQRRARELERLLPDVVLPMLVLEVDTSDHLVLPVT